MPTTVLFKDIFEKMICHNPVDRVDASEVLEHEFADDTQLYPEDVESEILAAFKNLEDVLGQDMDPFTDENQGSHRSDGECNPEREEWVRHDEEQFNKLRYTLISEVHQINKLLRKRRF